MNSGRLETHGKGLLLAGADLPQAPALGWLSRCGETQSVCLVHSEAKQAQSLEQSKVSCKGQPRRGLSWWISGEESACDAGDVSSFPGSGRSPGGGHGNLPQSSCWRIPMTVEPGRLQSTGSQRGRHNRMHARADSVTSLVCFLYL